MEVSGSKIILPNNCIPTIAYIKNNMATEDDDTFLSKLSLEYKEDDEKVVDSILNKDDDNISKNDLDWTCKNP